MRIHDISISLAGLLCGVALAAAGCGGGKDVQVANQGKLCIFPASGPATNNPFLPDTTPRQYAAGEAVDLSVLFPFCLSGSCMTNRMSSCTVEPSGNTFRVTATGSYHETGDNTCTTDCGVLNPHCATSALGEGTYTFEYAGGSVDLVVPSTVAPPCVGTAFGG